MLAAHRASAGAHRRVDTGNGAMTAHQFRKALEQQEPPNDRRNHAVLVCVADAYHAVQGVRMSEPKLVKWRSFLVTEEDAIALDADQAMYGTAYVRQRADQKHAERIPPEDVTK